jgi:hypothetical protein
MSAREFRDDDEEATCPGSPPTQEIFQFDAIIDVRVAAVRATQTSRRPRRPVRHERFNSARA